MVLCLKAKGMDQEEPEVNKMKILENLNCSFKLWIISIVTGCLGGWIHAGMSSMHTSTMEVIGS